MYQKFLCNPINPVAQVVPPQLAGVGDWMTRSAQTCVVRFFFKTFPQFHEEVLFQVGGDLGLAAQNECGIMTMRWKYGQD